MRTCCVLALLMGLTVLWDSCPVLAGPGESPRVVVRDSESGEPRSLDPHRAGDVISTRQCMHAYECLLEYDAFTPGALRPCLAEGMPVYDREKLTYTFKLRNDIRFADAPCFKDGKGRKVTAADVVFSFKRLAALPDSGGYWVVERQVAGLDEFRVAALEAAQESQTAWLKCLDSAVEGLRAIDERTISIRLLQPYAQFLHAITLPYGVVLPHEAAHEYEFTRQPVGTGPFVLKEYTASGLTWARNPNYRDVSLTAVPADSPLKAYEGRRLPLADELRYEIFADDQVVTKQFLEGKLVQMGLNRDDFAHFIDREAMKNGATGDDLLKEEWRKRAIRVVDYTEPTIHYISFNMNDAVVGTKAGGKGRAIRQAMSLAFDRNAYIEKHLSGRGTPANRLIPPGTPGHAEASELGNQKYDPAAGRKLLTEAGFELHEKNGAWTVTDADTGKQVIVRVLLRSTSDTTKEYAAWLVKTMATVGIAVECELMTFGEFLDRQDEGSGQAYDAGWVMDYPDAQNMLQLLYGPNKSPGINNAAFDNAEYNKRYEELARLDDSVPAERKRKGELIGEMHELLDRETPWITVDFRRIIRLQQGNFMCAPPAPFGYTNTKYNAIASKD